MSMPIGEGSSRRPKREGKRHGTRVKLLFHDVFSLVRCLDEIIAVLLHARFLGKGSQHLLGHTARQEDDLRPSRTKTPEVVGSKIKCPHLVDRKQERPREKSRVKVLQRPSFTEQLDGMRQDLACLSHLALIVIISFPVHLRHDGVDLIIGYPVEVVNEARRRASVALFNTN